MAKLRIKRNQHGNWYGYLGNTKVVMFSNTPEETQEQVARRWLADQEAYENPIVVRYFGTMKKSDLLPETHEFRAPTVEAAILEYRKRKRSRKGAHNGSYTLNGESYRI